MPRVMRRYRYRRLPYTYQTMRDFLDFDRPPRWRGRIINGRWEPYTACGSRTPEGARYNRLLRLRRRLSNRLRGGKKDIYD